MAIRYSQIGMETAIKANAVGYIRGGISYMKSARLPSKLILIKLYIHKYKYNEEINGADRRIGEGCQLR